MGDKLLTTEEVADILRCSTRYVRVLVHGNELPTVKVGKKYLIPADALTNWIHSCSKQDT